MLKTRKVLVSVAAATTLIASVAPAFAGCVGNDRGSPHADGGGWTQLIRTQHAGNTWEDWFWRGRWEGHVFQCPWGNADRSCPITMDFTKGTTHAKEINFGFNASGGTNDWFTKAVGSLAASFGYSKQRSYNNSFSFRPGGSILRGQAVEPITKQVRRWEQGYYRGGWVMNRQTGQTRGGYQWCYDFDQGRNFGGWTTNTAEGPAMHSYHIWWP